MQYLRSLLDIPYHTGGLTLEMSATLSFHGGNFTFINRLEAKFSAFLPVL